MNDSVEQRVGKASKARTVQTSIDGCCRCDVAVVRYPRVCRQTYQRQRRLCVTVAALKCTQFIIRYLVNPQLCKFHKRIC